MVIHECLITFANTIHGVPSCEADHRNDQIFFSICGSNYAAVCVCGVFACNDNLNGFRILRFLRPFQPDFTGLLEFLSSIIGLLHFRRSCV